MARNLHPDTIDLTAMIRSSSEHGWTQSEITTLDNCGMLWFWRYGMMLDRVGLASWASIYGTACHSTWEEMYATKGKRWSPAPLIIPLASLSLEQQSKRKYYEGILPVQMEAYANYWKDDFQFFTVQKMELVLDHTLPNGIRLTGKVDLIFTLTDDGLWILDHKTCARLDLKTVMGWDFRFQFMFYVWLAWRSLGTNFKGYYVNAMKKPEIKQKVKQHESWEQFLARLGAEMCMEPEKYFYRERLLMNQGSLEYFEEHVLGPKLHRIALLTNPDVSDSIKNSIVKNMNTDYCQRYGGPCSYLPLCNHGFDLEGFQYQQRAVKHTELEESE
jgi:hypothetical protein